MLINLLVYVIGNYAIVETMATYDNHRFAYYRFIKDHNLYPEFKRWVSSKNPAEGVSSVRMMSLFLVHKGLRNEMIDHPRYDRDAAINVHYRSLGVDTIFDMTDEEYKNVVSAKWLYED